MSWTYAKLSSGLDLSIMYMRCLSLSVHARMHGEWIAKTISCLSTFVSFSCSSFCFFLQQNTKPQSTTAVLSSGLSDCLPHVIPLNMHNTPTLERTHPNAWKRKDEKTEITRIEKHNTKRWQEIICQTQPANMFVLFSLRLGQDAHITVRHPFIDANLNERRPAFLSWQLTNTLEQTLSAKQLNSDIHFTMTWNISSCTLSENWNINTNITLKNAHLLS